MMHTPRLIQVYLLDGTIEGARIIELSQSNIKAFVVPRLKLGYIKYRDDTKRPAIYALIDSQDGTTYIGESENGLSRIAQHARTKEFWDMCVLFVSIDNALEKSDIKYLESLLVERALATSSVRLMNSTAPKPNVVHEFKVHSLRLIASDIALLLKYLGYSVLDAPGSELASTQNEIWFCTSKKSIASAMFKGDKFVVLGSSTIDTSYAESWASSYPAKLEERIALLNEYGIRKGEMVDLVQNISFRSPHQAACFVTGRSVNAWITWKNSFGMTMDEVMRKNTL